MLQIYIFFYYFKNIYIFFYYKTYESKPFEIKQRVDPLFSVQTTLFLFQKFINSFYKISIYKRPFLDIYYILKRIFITKKVLDKNQIVFF